MDTRANEPTFAPMVESCGIFGISRTVAFELARKGLLQTFQIGTRRYVILASLHDLPKRLAERAP